MWEATIHNSDDAIDVVQALITPAKGGEAMTKYDDGSWRNEMTQHFEEKAAKMRSLFTRLTNVLGEELSEDLIEFIRDDKKSKWPLREE